MFYIGVFAVPAHEKSESKKSPDNEGLPSIDELSRKIQKAKQEALIPEEKKAASGAMHVSVELVAGVVAGLLVGYYLDTWLGTKPVFIVICFLLGFAGALKNIIRSVENSDHNE